MLSLRSLRIRRAAAVAAAALALGLLAGCGFGAEPTPTPEPLTLRYITYPGMAAGEKALIAGYEADHPQTTVVVAPYSQLPIDYVEDSPAPDVMLITPGEFLDTTVAAGGLADLSNLWQESGAAQSLLPGLRSLSEYEGKQFYLPVGYSWNGFFYDKAVFEQYGLQPPATWDEFLQVCETLWLNGVVPLSMSGEDPFMGTLWLDYLDLRLNGPEVHRQLIAGELPFTDPRIRSVFESWVALVERGYFNEAAPNMGPQEALAAVVQKGKILGPKPAMVLAGSAFLGELVPELRAKLGFFPFPVMDSSQPLAEVVTAIGYMVPSNAGHRDAAVDFVSYLVSDKGREILNTQVVAGGLQAPAFAVEDKTALPETVRQGMALVEGAQTVMAPLYMSVNAELWPALALMQQQILKGPGSGEGFDLDAVLARLEAAR